MGQVRIAATSLCCKFALQQHLSAASSLCCKLGRPHLPTGHLTAPHPGAKRAFDAYAFLSSSVSVTIVLTLSLAKEASDELCCMTTSLHIKLLPSHDAAVSPLLQAHYAATRPVASSPCCKFDMNALLQFCSTASSQCSKFSLLQVCCAATSFAASLPCCKLCWAHKPTGHLSAFHPAAKRAFGAYAFLWTTVSVTTVLTFFLSKHPSDELYCMSTLLHVNLLSSHYATGSH